ncbi:adenylate/guanylate cyclase domain-containing protein, partial [bacterium CPR1]|nr:adenylate/guanylate cyclase domain-containing protein [bacterium CPR1]
YVNSIDWPLILPLGAMATSFLAVNIAHVVTRNRRIAQRDEVIRNVQGILKELTPVDYDDLLATNGLVLGGKATELTVLFSDLRGYTSMAEKLTSVEVIDRLNDYFALLGPLLERFGGAVFDYQGDALMAVFGLKPNSQPNHAAAGCKAAAAIIYELEKQRKEWLRQGRPMPETGIGICTGMVAFGGLGTAQHKQYVAIGDPTNTASRMQGKSKELDSPVLITESTYEMAKSDADVVMEYLEEIELKGKREPLKVYGVLVDPTALKLNLVSQVAPGAAPLHEQSPLL